MDGVARESAITHTHTDTETDTDTHTHTHTHYILSMHPSGALIAAAMSWLL